MNSKSAVWTGMFIGSSVGSYVPVLWGAGLLSFSSVILAAVGGLLGIYIGFKLSNL